MVWVKRLSPIVIALLIWYTAGWYQNREKRLALESVRPQAKLIAEIWTASALYRATPEKYYQFRDSLFQSTGITRDSLLAFLEKCKSDPEFTTLIAEQVNGRVDSLTAKAESLLVIEADSVGSASRSSDSTR